MLFKRKYLVKNQKISFLNAFLKCLSVLFLPFLQDRIGLRKLNDTGRLHFLGIDGDHLKIKLEWFKENIIERFLK